MRYFSAFALLLCGITAAAPINHQSGDEYTVILNATHPDSPKVHDVLNRLSLSSDHEDVLHTYNNSAFSGFSAKMNDHCLNALNNMSGIAAVVEKAVPVSSALTARVNAPWGLQRISTAAAVSGADDVLSYIYTYANAGLAYGADVYIVDTGIYTEHSVFGGRASPGYSLDNTTTDNDGHGTHVAGIAAGASVGIASNANIIGVKALDDLSTGWSSNVVAAINWVIQQHTFKSANDGFVGSVMSMSFEAVQNAAMSQAISAASLYGIHSVVAAGNDGADACNSTPGSSGGTKGPAISVGSIAMDATISTFSNTGPCVDVYAPGENVISSWNTGVTALKSLTGTSMSTPHVTGIVAYAMANETLARDPRLMKAWIRYTALQDIVMGKVVEGDEKLLANNGIPGMGPIDDGLIGIG